MITTPNRLKVTFSIFLKTIGKEQGFKPGQWSMDYASCYGGYIITENLENGCEHHPLLSRRLPRKEMISALEMAIDVIRLKND